MIRKTYFCFLCHTKSKDQTNNASKMGGIRVIGGIYTWNSRICIDYLVPFYLRMHSG